MLVSELAQHVKGQVQGNGALRVNSVSTFEQAQANDLVFVLSEKNLTPALASAAGVIVIHEKISIPQSFKTYIKVDNIKLAMANILKLFEEESLVAGMIHPSAVIGEGVSMGKGVRIGANCSIGNNVVIGDYTTVYSGVNIYAKVKIGAHVVLHSGAVIGAEGFGFLRHADNIVKIPQIGSVIIEDYVEIGANSTIDRGTIGATIIGAGTKIDNLVQIAHNCKIGKNCLIAAQSAVAGSSELANGVTMGGQSGVIDHVKIEDNVIIAGRAGVTKDTPSNTIVSGFPAREHSEEMKFWAKLKRLTKKQ
ncbi:MAG: UDP-3-O-(3-hydroxymyristoyl)glucosamine N-acyltransferase [Candidatus Margulisiibacteriota bacterium]